MSQGPHDPFLASAAALAPAPPIRWGPHLRSGLSIVVGAMGIVEIILLMIYAPVWAALPAAAIAAIPLARHARRAWALALTALAAGAVGLFLSAPITTSIAFAYPAFFACVIALAQSGRIMAALVTAVSVSVLATLFLDVFQTQVSYGDKKVIVVAEMWAQGESKQAIFDDVIRQFEAKYPAYKVVVRWDGRWVLSMNRPRLLTRKDVPDLIEGAKEELQIVVQENYAVALDPYMNRISPETGKPWREDWIPQLYDLGRYRLNPLERNGVEISPNPLDGKLTLASGIYYDFVYFYNKAIARRLGIEKTPETWEEFLAACQKARDAGIEPIMLDTSYQDLMGETLIQASVPAETLRTTILGGAGRKPFTDPIYQRLFEVERTVSDRYLMTGWKASAYPKAQQRFATGTGLFILCGTWLPGELGAKAAKDPAVFELGVMPFLRFNDEPAGTSVIQDSGWVLLKDGNEREGAVKLLQFISDHWGRKIALEDGNPVAFARDPIPPALAEISDELKHMKRAVSNLPELFAPKWRQYVFVQLHQDFFQATPGQAEYMTAAQFLEKLEEKTLKYQQEGGENKWR